MKFKITNLTDGTVPFSAGSVLQPGTSRPVEVISLELKRLESRGMVKIDPMPDEVGAPPDLKSDYEPDVRLPVGGLTEEQAARIETMWNSLFSAGFVLPDVSDFTFTQNGLDVSVTAVTPLTPLAVGVDTYVAIDWGDGTPEGSSLMGPWNHTYAQDGTYQVRVRYAGNWNTFGVPVTKTLSVAD